MRKTIFILFIFIISSHLLSQNLEGLEFGTDNTLEVMTWNLEWFPTSGETTLDYVTQILEALDIDLIALQEIDDKAMFELLLEGLDGWEGYYVDSEYLALAYLYKSGVIEVEEIFTIYESNNREFPRAPLVMKMKYRDEDFVIINNHLKCCGDGNLNLNNTWDEETRRYDACNLLEQYIRIFYPDKNVILLGDLNDVLNDNPINNVFQTFFENPENYLFADIDIAEGSSADWSYPTWPSHLDHIMISDELFDEFAEFEAEIQTIKIDDYLLNGWYEYENYVSDHRPVAIKLKIASNATSFDNKQNKAEFINYPNPFDGYTTFTFDPATESSEIEIRTITGKLIQSLNVKKGQTSMDWNAKVLPAGIYFATLMVDHKRIVKTKLALTR